MKFLVLLGVVLLLAGGWCGAWFYLRGLMVDRLEGELTRLADTGIVIECPDLAVAGFPFRYEVSCTGFELDDADRHYASLGALQSVALIYNPTHVILEVAGPATFVDRGRFWQMQADWGRAQSSVRFGTRGVYQLDAEFTDLDLLVSSFAGDLKLLSAKSRLHLREKPETDEALEIVLDLQDISAEELIGNWPSLRGLAHLELAGGAGLLSGMDLRDVQARQNGQLVVNIQSLALGSDTEGLQATGALSVDPSGLVSGELTVSFENIERLADRLESLDPQRNAEAANMIRTMVPLVAQRTEGEDGRSRLQLPITIRQGKVMLGFIQIGVVPPVRL